MKSLTHNYRVKYPRTSHLPWSLGVADDDRVIQDLSHFVGKRVIVTKKMDGENTTMYSDHIHARSIDSSGGSDRDWVKGFWSTIAHDIPEFWRICGENLWAEHSIHYTDLVSYFLGFSVWNEMNVCLSWDDTLWYLDMLGIHPVPLLYDGIWDEKKIRALEKDLDWKTDEGYVVRLADSFTYREFKVSIAKFVRKGHVQTSVFWRHKTFVQNELKK